MGIFSAYRTPCNSNIENFLGNLSDLLKKYLGKYDNVIIMDDFNIDVKYKTNPNFDKFSEFCDTFSTSNLVKITLASLKLTNQVLTFLNFFHTSSNCG